MIETSRPPSHTGSEERKNPAGLIDVLKYTDVEKRVPAGVMNDSSNICRLSSMIVYWTYSATATNRIIADRRDTNTPDSDLPVHKAAMKG